MKMDMNLLLCALLECGTADLTVIEDCEYDISDILESADMFVDDGKYDLGALVFAIAMIAKGKVEDAVESKIEELEDELEDLEEWNNEEVHGNQIESLKNAITELKSLNPHEDFEVWFNYLDTNISCVENSDAYQNHLEDVVNDIFAESGLHFYF